MTVDYFMESVRRLFRKFKDDIQLYRNILADPRTPRMTRILLGIAVAYAVTPLDIIPDFIPVIGHLDDAIILPLLVYFALKAIPRSLLEEHRKKMISSGTERRD